MKFEDFLSGITYNPAPPANPIEELAYTTLPENNQQMKRILFEICTSVPKFSTFCLAAIINKAVSQLPENQAYVNVGVWHGFSFLAGMINNPSKKCIGVDNFSEFGSPRADFFQRFHRYKSQNHHFYDMDYVDFFKIFHEPIGFYFYDGEHSYENQWKGLQLAEPNFSKNCIIMIDDTNWEAPRKATFDFISASANQYKVLMDVSHPTFSNGVLIIQKVN